LIHDLNLAGRFHLVVNTTRRYSIAVK